MTVTVDCPVCEDPAAPDEIELQDSEVPVYQRSTGFTGDVTALHKTTTQVAVFPCGHHIKTVP